MPASTEDIAGRQARMIARLAEATLSAVEILHERLEAAETPEATERLALALHRVGRGLRQCLLVENKLLKEHRAMAREDAAQEAAQAAKAEEAPREARKAQVRGQVARVAVETCESPEDADAVLDDLDLWVEVYARAGALETWTPEKLATELCQDLGVTFPEGGAPPWDRPSEPAPAPAESVPGPEPGSAPAPRLVQGPDYGWYPAPDSS